MKIVKIAVSVFIAASVAVQCHRSFSMMDLNESNVQGYIQLAQEIKQEVPGALPKLSRILLEKEGQVFQDGELQKLQELSSDSKFAYIHDAAVFHSRVLGLFDRIKEKKSLSKVEAFHIQEQNRLKDLIQHTTDPDKKKMFTDI